MCCRRVATLIVTVIALASCDRTPKDAPDAGRRASAIFTDAAATGARPKGETEEAIRARVMAWNTSISARDVAPLQALYAPEATAYGVKRTRDEIIRGKSEFFRNHPDASQSLDPSIHVEMRGDDAANARFVKRVTSHGTTKRYPSYLGFRLIDGSWAITIEGDDETDRNLTSLAAKKAAGGASKPSQVTCVDAVMDLVIASPEPAGKIRDLEREAKRQHVDVPAGVRLDASPEDEGSHGRYRLMLYEDHPDHASAVGFYEVDPSTGTLYAWDGETASPIEGDKTAVTKVKEGCAR